MSTNVPTSLIAGDTWSWMASFTDYPASVWTVTFYFQNAKGAFIVPATASGDDHLAAKTATDTKTVATGKYAWRARAVSGATVLTIDEGWTEIQPDAAAARADLRSTARILLEAVEATLVGRATDGQLEMSIGNRLIKRIPLPELMQLRDRMKEEVSTEDKGVKAGLSRQLRTRLFRA